MEMLSEVTAMKNKYLCLSLILLLLLAIPQSAISAMSDYCSAPPYVTRTIAPNIMVLMDNSDDMMGPAYTDEVYTPNATKDNYIGYFKPTGCYESTGVKFLELLNTTATPNRTYNAGESCPEAAPFRGNLLNWATMSKFDVLQKVLIGGNSASKQGNAHTLVSISGSNWPTKYENSSHVGCVFNVSNGTLEITEGVPDSCTLLDSPPVAIAMQSSEGSVAPIALDSPRSLNLALTDYLQNVSGGVDEALMSAAKFWESFELVPSAWAATCPSVQIGPLDVNEGESFRLIMTLPKSVAGKTTSWTVLDKPAWLGDGELGNYKKTTGGTITWEGVAESEVVDGDNDFSVRVTSETCDAPTDPITGTINVISTDLKINHTSPLPDGKVGEAYSVELRGQGGEGALSWSAIDLPAGLSIGTFTSGTVTNYYIEGTPTAVGTSTITLTLSDSASTPNTLSEEFQLSILQGLNITTQQLPGGQVGEPYNATIAVGGGTPGYTFSITSGSLPTDVSMDADGVFSGTIASGTEGDYPITIQVEDANGRTADKNYTLTIVAALGHVEIFSGYFLPTTYAGESFSYQIVASGGCAFDASISASDTLNYTNFYNGTQPAGSSAFDDGDYVIEDYDGGYMWKVYNSTTDPLPSWMSLDPTTGILSGTPDNTADTTYDEFAISVMACGYHIDTQRFSITSMLRKQDTDQRSQKFNVKVDLIEEPLTDLNGNDSWDLGETYTDSNGNGEWDGKYGVFHKFWDANDPKARWGMTKTKEQGGSTEPNVSTCIPVTSSASFFTNIQNATAVSSAPLADALYGAINYYKFNQTGYSGCTNSDPIDNVPCRKNFVLMITSGADLTGQRFPDDANCSDSDPLVQNACYGYQTDLRTGSDGKQNAFTYIVNTMGTDEAETALTDVAAAGGGALYAAKTGSEIEAELTKAIEDILAQAASGTAVSVLTTSSRGIGSMMQAYFLPVRQEGAREVRWTGYVQNLWIDPDDNLREDTGADLKLNLTQDNVLKLYFDEATNETKAALFDNDALESCTIDNADTDIIDFDEVDYNWEGGYKLALKDPSARDIITARKVIHGATVVDTFSETEATFTTADLGTDLKTALDADATYSADEIIRYIRGECLEGSVTGDTDCSATADPDFRDRRVTIPSGEGGATNGNVWKLGDVISSTPKVLANTPNNTYHIDYGDTTYYQYVSDDSTGGYAQRSSIALVGANDGMLHAFRVGYLQDTGITESNVLGFFKNLFNDSDTDEIGDEVWSYIPYNALPYLKYLADPDYCHMYYNDLSVRITDASLGCDTSVDSSCDEPDEARKKESWRTVLVGGMRFGGGCDGGVPAPPGTVTNVGYSSYYAIDITDSENPVPLWEFSDPDMGYATGFPSILRTGAASTNGNWYVAFGSGSTTMPKSATDIGRTTDGYLYILDLETGEIAKKILLDHDAIVGDILTIDKNKNYITEKLYFGTSYDDAGTWKGKVISLDIPNQDLSDTWTPSLKTLFTGDYPFTASPDAANDEGGNTWVYAGSGKYFSDADEDTADTQIFIGLKDLSSVTYPVTTATTGVDDKTSVTTTGTVAETTEVCGYDSDTNSFGMQTVVTRTNQTSADATVPDIGWYVSLADGERVISRPLAVGGLVDYLTYKPSSDDCSYGGDSYLYAVGYTTGEAPAKIAIRNTQTTGDATSGSVNISKGIRLGPGAPPTGEAIIIPPPKEAQQQLKKKIQVATGVIIEAENTPAMSITSEVVHWLKK